MIKGECSQDSFTPDYERIVLLANEVFDEEFLRDWHGFSFNGGIIKPLWMIALHCRQPMI
jgi:hypothetical protein